MLGVPHGCFLLCDSINLTNQQEKEKYDNEVGSGHLPARTELAVPVGVE